MSSTKSRYCFFTSILCLIILSSCTSRIENKSSTTTFSLKTARYGHATATNEESIFVFGGSGKSGFLSDIEIINPKAREVVQLKDKLIPRRYHSAVWDGNDSIYILGGVSKDRRYWTVESAVERFSISSQKVSIVGAMPDPRRFGSAVYLDGKIVVSGGESFLHQKDTKLTNTSSVSIYDIARDSWQRAKPMPTAKQTKTVVKNGQIYAVGGYNGDVSLSVFEKFSLKTNQWQSLPPLPQQLSANSILTIGNKIYSFGDYTNLSAVYSYDINSQQWEKLNIGYKASRHNTAVVIGNKVYVIGGTIASSGSRLDYIQEFEL